jgi:hypothetical protein
MVVTITAIAAVAMQALRQLVAGPEQHQPEATQVRQLVAAAREQALLLAA